MDQLAFDFLPIRQTDDANTGQTTSILVRARSYNVLSQGFYLKFSIKWTERSSIDAGGVGPSSILGSTAAIGL